MLEQNLNRIESKRQFLIASSIRSQNRTLIGLKASSKETIPNPIDGQNRTLIGLKVNFLTAIKTFSYLLEQNLNRIESNNV